MPSFMDKVKQAAGGVAEATKKGAATAQTKAPMPSVVRTAWARLQFFTRLCERSLG